MKKNCNCEIGIFYHDNEILTKNTVLDVLTVHYKTNKLLYGDEKLITPLQYIDKRSGYMYHFSYCPICGSKIDWKKIRIKLKLE